MNNDFGPGQPDPNQPDPQREIERLRSSPPTIPSVLKSDLSNGILTPKDVTDLTSKGLIVNPKPGPDICLSASHRERFINSGIANIRPTEAQGHPAVVFHFLEISDWETVELILSDPGTTPLDAFLVAQAIRSARLPNLLIGTLTRGLAVSDYNHYPPFAKVGTINWPAEVASRDAKINALKKEAQQKDSCIGRSETEVENLKEQLLKAQSLIERKVKCWKSVLKGFAWGFALGAVLCAITLYNKNML